MPPSRAHGGTFRDRHDTQGAGCGGRGNLRRYGLISERDQGPLPDEGAQRTAKSCGPGAATLALPAGACSRKTGARKAASPGRARISRKTIARGKPGCLGCTCQNRVHSFASFRTRRCGRSRRPAFPAPSVERGTTRLHNSGGKPAARSRDHVFIVIPGSRLRRAPE